MMKACARPPGRAGRHRKSQPHCAPSPKSCSKRGCILRCRDDQDVANAGKHQRRKRIIDHRLVVHGKQLLGNRLSHRIKPCAGTAGKDDAFHSRSISGEKAVHTFEIISFTIAF